MALQPNSDDDLFRKEAKSELQFVFQWFDTDGNGQMDSKELNVLFRALNLSFPVISTELEWTLNHSRSLHFDEFVDLLLPHMEHLDVLLEAFRQFDTNGDGVVDADDLREIFSDFGIDVDDEEILYIIAKSDQNTDGKIDFKEYLEAGSNCFTVGSPRKVIEEKNDSKGDVDLNGYGTDERLKEDQQLINGRKRESPRSDMETEEEFGHRGCWCFCFGNKSKGNGKQMKTKSGKVKIRQYSMELLR